MSNTTRFMLLVRERGWDSFEAFSIAFRKAAQRAAVQESNPRLARVVTSRSSFDRWVRGGIKGTPRREPALVLRYMFNMSVERLFEKVDPARALPLNGPAMHQYRLVKVVFDLDIGR